MLPKINGIMRINSKEIRYIPSGQAVIKLNCVSSEKYKTQSGEQKENSCWIECVSFGKQAESINTYFNEKDRIFINGSLKQESWMAQDNTKRSKHVVTIDSFDFIEKKDNSQTNNYDNQGNYNQTQPQQQQYNAPQNNMRGKPTGERDQYGNPIYQPNQQQDVPTIDIDNDTIPF